MTRKLKQWPNNFYERIDFGDDNDCWEWTGGVNRARGYGAVGIGNNVYMVHRLTWMLDNCQTIPSGLVVMHNCDNPPCCNPAHLRLGTRSDNSKDAENKGRRTHERKLDAMQTLEAKEKYLYRSYKIPQLISEYGARVMDSIKASLIDDEKIIYDAVVDKNKRHSLGIALSEETKQKISNATKIAWRKRKGLV